MHASSFPNMTIDINSLKAMIEQYVIIQLPENLPIELNNIDSDDNEELAEGPAQYEERNTSSFEG